MTALVHIFRLTRAGWVLARHGAAIILAGGELPAPARFVLRLIARREEVGAGRNGNDVGRMSRALATLGPSYIKLGQFLATRPDVIGQALAADLSKLRDKLPPFPSERARAEVKAALGQPVEALYDSFSEPLAAASIAQVHKASLRDASGQPRAVAVKILRPGVERRFARDLETFYFAARQIERWYPPSRRLRPIAVVDMLAQWVELEMDLRLEAAAISEMAANIERAGDTDFRVPAVDWTRTARRVLTTEWIDAIPLGDLAAIDDAGLDRAALGNRVIRSFLRHALRDGFFHADMHQGNLFVDRAGTLIAVDFGIMGRLGWKERRFLAEILHGFILRDYRRVAEVHFEAGYVPAEQDVATFAQALRSIGEPLQGRIAHEISMAHLLGQLFQITELFNMRTRPELLLLQKTMVVVEGVARSLDPQLNMWTAAEPVVRDWMETELGPGARLREAAEGVAGLLSAVPRLAEQARRASEGPPGGEGLRLDQPSIEKLAAAQARHGRASRLALWLGALALAAIALKLWIAG